MVASHVFNVYPIDESESKSTTLKYSSDSSEPDMRLTNCSVALYIAWIDLQGTTFLIATTVFFIFPELISGTFIKLL